MAPTTERTTRRPTGKAPWPFLNIAGADKCGKSYSAVEASASPLVGRTFLIEVGEGDADQYGLIPGADFEIVPHDGSYADILAAVEWASAKPRDEQGRPNLIVLDSGTELWDMLADEQNIIARERAARKAAQGNSRAAKQASGEVEVDVTMDQWNVAKRRWRRLIDVLRKHDGPTIITTRLELVTVMQNGKPTTDKVWKVRAEKNLGFEVTGTIQLREYRKALITGLRSARLSAEPDEERRYPNFTFDSLWRAMGMDEANTIAPRNYTAPNPEAGAKEIAADNARQESEGGLPDAGVVAEAIQEAVDSPNRVAALIAVGEKYGREALNQVPIRVDGQTVSATKRIENLIAWARQEEAQAQQQPQQHEGDPAEQAAMASAEQQPEPPAEQQAENARQEQYADKANAPERLARAWVMDEIAGQASVAGVPPMEYVKEFLAAHGADNPNGVTFAALKGFAVKRRPEVIRALREQGRASEADALSKAPKDPAPWARLTAQDARDDAQPAREEQPANA